MSDETDKKSPLEAYFIESGMPEAAARILYVALGLFATKGYTATSVREIVQEANVTNPMLYYYFDNKEGVFHKLIDLLFNGLQGSIEHILLDDDLTLRQKLRSVIDLHLDGVGEAHEALFFVYSVLFGPRESRPPIDVRDLRSKNFEQLIEVFGKAIEAGEFVPNHCGEPPYLAMQFFGLINQHMMFALKALEAANSEDDGLDRVLGIAPQPEAIIAFMSGEQARARLLDFFLGGAGALRDDARESKETGVRDEMA
jgi:AcrR family transcriptional regulator